MNVSKTLRLVKAAQFRLNSATTNLATQQQAFTSALADLKAGVADAKQRANEAAVAVKEANAKVTEAQNEVATREAEADKASDAFKRHNVSRPKREHRDYHLRGNARAGPQTEADAYPDMPLDAISVSAYHATAKAAFADYASMQAFPAPPSAVCSNLSCLQSREDRPIDACPCNIKETFSGLTAKELKSAKANFHPDRFSKTNDAIRADCQAKASYVHKIVSQISQQSRTDKSKKTQNYQQVARSNNNRSGGRQ